ncbi:FkbM family methyltransferase [Synoicihabitans lomoniglobus]|uniref:FkbM family methyltransferase n=1 Tax=Synoicihabitans lomoniglobus TaxID=2909285 RepID=A0AAF0CSU2_9BACT|nr:FkbM family methyltransferase [Opitutaceae bacterium LMO-M01]WED67326.1 FkbM family methyltransferase [Opitutaceae bacterium LMO-M01]
MHRAFRDLHGLRFLQIGANDGQRNDPIFSFIRAFGWHGTLVEPNLDFVVKLESLHRRAPRIRIVPAAIAEGRATRPFYRIDASIPGLPNFAQGLATLDYNRILTACRDLGLSDSGIVQDMIDVIVWSDLDPESRLAETEVLVIDAEGYDLTLLRLWDWQRVRPPIVHFEHACADPAEYRHFLGELSGYGYDYVVEGDNTTAFLPLH